MAVAQQITSISKFYGLRTDMPASKCPQNYSPDCSDLVFTVDGVDTRPPFMLQATLPAEIVYRDEFTAKDGSKQRIALDVNGILYSIAEDNSFTQIDMVSPGSRVSAVTAYGWKYLSFFKDGQGSDAPRRWDGKQISRVSPGGPGAAPTVSNYALPSVGLIAGSAGSAVALVSAVPGDPVTVQVGGNDFPGDGGYNPPQYETFNTTLLYTSTSSHGLVAGEVVTISGNSLYNFPAISVLIVISATQFKISYQTPSGSVGNGGSVTPQAPFLSRTANIVTANTTSAHSLRVGYQATIAGVEDQTISISSIVIDNNTSNGIATITTPTSHGFVPNNTIYISGVVNAAVGGGITSYSVTNTGPDAGTATVTTSTDHNLSTGQVVFIQFGTGAITARTVGAIISSTSFNFELPDVSTSGTTGNIYLAWPGEDGEAYTVAEVPNSTSFTINVGGYPTGTWTTGSITFPWNGTFYVTKVLSATSFQYRQSGPDSLIQSGSGTVTPTGQIAAGDHQVVQHFIYRSGYISAPSPPFKFTASGGQYALVQGLAIGSDQVVGRILSFTGTNGGQFYMLQVPAQVNGLQVSSSTRVDDNVTTSVLVDFSDLSLLGGDEIDIPGNNLFQQVTLNTPRGVRWYGDRLGWIGESNAIKGFLNLNFDGGTNSGSTSPLGWKGVGVGSVQEYGTMPAYVVVGPDTGEITQGAAVDSFGNTIIQPNQAITLRFWGSPGATGTLTATFTAASTGFTSTASFDIGSITSVGYYSANFNNSIPSSIPSDMQISYKFVGLVGTIRTRDIQFIYTSNPYRNPLARLSYVQNPEAYDALTGNIGPNNDSSELRGIFDLGTNLYFVTAKGLYYTQQITNNEPSSWYVDRIADKCGAFNQECIITGRGWATWSGSLGQFWFSGGIPEKTTEVIAPTWRGTSDVLCSYDDSDAERVYICTVDSVGNKRMLVYDYHEISLGGSGKWSPWNRPVNWIGSSDNGTTFVIGASFFTLSVAVGVADYLLGNIGGYIILPPIAPSMMKKEYSYAGIEISGQGPLVPELYLKTLADTPIPLNAGNLEDAVEPVFEWQTMALKARRLWMKLGHPGVQFSLQNASFVWQVDPNAPISGVK